MIWHTYNQVKSWLKEHTTGEHADFVILNEYDEKLTYTEFIKLIDSEQNNKHNLENPDNFTYSKNVDGYRFSSEYFS